MVEVEARSLSLRDEWYFTSCCHTPNQRLCQVVDRMSPLELGYASHVMTLPPGGYWPQHRFSVYVHRLVSRGAATHIYRPISAVSRLMLLRSVGQTVGNRF